MTVPSDREGCVRTDRTDSTDMAGFRPDIQAAVRICRRRPRVGAGVLDSPDHRFRNYRFRAVEDAGPYEKDTRPRVPVTGMTVPSVPSDYRD